MPVDIKKRDIAVGAFILLVIMTGGCCVSIVTGAAGLLGLTKQPSMQRTPEQSRELIPTPEAHAKDNH